jgi:hypothetical protein
LDQPHENTLKCLQLVLTRYREKHQDFLPEPEAFTWFGTEGLNDYLTIRAPESQRDPFQEHLNEYLTPWFTSIFYFWKSLRLFRGKQDAVDEEKEQLEIHYEAKWFGAVGALLIAIFSALLPLISILILYFIKRTITKIYTLFGLTVVFALAVKWITRAKSMDIFAVTAA